MIFSRKKNIIFFNKIHVMSRENMILLLSGRMRRQLLYELFNNFAFRNENCTLLWRTEQSQN